VVEDCPWTNVARERALRSRKTDTARVKRRIARSFDALGCAGLAV
jgi:hypothetical protein